MLVDIVPLANILPWNIKLIMSHGSYSHGATIKAGSSVLQSTFFVSNLIILSFSMPLQLVYSCTRVFFNTVLCIDMNSTLSTSFSIIIGVIILVELIDERFREERNRAFISKWLRRPLRVYDSFDLSLEGLKSFFEDAKVHGMLVHYNLPLSSSRFSGERIINIWSTCCRNIMA